VSEAGGLRESSGASVGETQIVTVVEGTATPGTMAPGAVADGIVAGGVGGGVAGFLTCVGDVEVGWDL